MKEKQKIHYSVWKRFVDGIYTCKDIEELLADTKTDRSKDFDEASACLWKTGEEESSSSWEEWISNERQALQIISNYEDRRRNHSIYLVKKWGSIAAAILLCIVLSVVYFANPAGMKVAQYEIHVPYGNIIRKSKFPQNPKRSVRFSGKRTKRSVQKRKAHNTQKAETKVL